MDVDLIFKIAAIGIIVAVLNQLLIRSGREEQAMMTTLAGLIVVLMMVIQEIDTPVSYTHLEPKFGVRSLWQDGKATHTAPTIRWYRPGKMRGRQASPP